MQRVSYRTLFLLVVLLGLVIAQQHTAQAVCVRPGVVWLADDPNDPGPEWIGSAGLQMRSDDDPNGPELALGVPATLRLDEDANDPGPEVALGIPSALRLDDDPNGPERV